MLFRSAHKSSLGSQSARFLDILVGLGSKLFYIDQAKARKRDSHQKSQEPEQLTPDRERKEDSHWRKVHRLSDDMRNQKKS